MKDISIILRQCPTGTKLFSRSIGNCTLDSVQEDKIIVRNSYDQFQFDKFGCRQGNKDCDLFLRWAIDWNKVYMPKRGELIKVGYDIFVASGKVVDDFPEYLCGVNTITRAVYTIPDTDTNLWHGTPITDEEKFLEVVRGSGFKWCPDTLCLKALFKTFDKVLVRNYGEWIAGFFDKYSNPSFKIIADDTLYSECIPFNKELYDCV